MDGATANNYRVRTLDEVEWKVRNQRRYVPQERDELGHDN
jgi:hypothetical protein